MRLRTLLLSLIIGGACTQPPEPVQEETAPAAVEASANEPVTFINRVWSVAERSDGSDPGSLYIFLSDGTLVISSPNATPSLGSWRAEDDGLVMIEEGIRYDVDILAVSPGEFRIRSHNPGEPLDIRFVPAATAPATVSAAFRVPAAHAGRLDVSGDQLRFAACGEANEGRVVVDATQDASALVAELGAGSAIPVMLRMDGDRITDIRYAGPGEVRCDRLPPDAVVEARGNEPFWMLAVAGDTAVFRTPERQDGIAYAGGRWTRKGEDEWRYEASLADATSAAGSTIELRLMEADCSDSMSGARFPYRAVLTLGTDRFEGCALEGRRAMS